jgi:hypothetical protein
VNTYEVELPDGTTMTRKSKMTFSHAVIVKEVSYGTDRDWYVASFAGSKDLAQKAVLATESRYLKPRNNGEWVGTQFQIVEVKAVA